MVVTLQQVEEFVRRDNGLAVVSVIGRDGAPIGSVVNAGILDHPVTGEPTAAFVVRHDAKKVAHLTANPFVSLVWRHDWSWVSVSGPSELVGPDNPNPGLQPDAVRLLLRQVFTSAGGTHDDWDEYDRAMLAERRLAVLVTPTRLTGNPHI
jgi:PPOX class probable F420-dependent enzyme